ncbi:hypothetical protein SEA_GILGAMESH_138 [Streptomyces phage Gilgamesh]|uniref:Uncharacterized protein n=1 Tax=Streptomyces phage Gilgamesh TaxID=2599890 RepID=A0A5J6TR94_9CAUD|nr:hypothetical protein QEH35_gp138 [Streptomyces phage Gilgamesh]QFG13330.1 hypothetical protein SEA_GILGAMESH_138 [Streptomyces phage Gilgamesh]
MSEPTAPHAVSSSAVSLAQMIDPSAPPVVMSVTLTVDGAEFTQEQLLDRYAWDLISSDPQMRAGYENSLRHKLAAAIVERLAPPVTVHVPPSVADTARLAGVEV